LGHYVARLALVFGLTVPSIGWGQLPPVGVPGGTLRVDLDGSFNWFDRQFNAGKLESITQPNLSLTDAHADVGTAGFGAGLGLTNALTIFGRLPGIRTRVQTVSDPALAGPVISSRPVFFRGEGEIGLALTAIDRWDRGSKRGGLRAALAALVRFPTGGRARNDRLLDIGTGEGQTDVQLTLTADLGGGPLGARLTGSYNHQLPATMFVLLVPPGQPLIGPGSLARVRRDPGDVITLGVRPFYRLARTFALEAGLEHWNREADEVIYATAADSVPGVDPATLGPDTKFHNTVLSLGVTYSNPGGLRRGGKGLPVDASWSYERILWEGGGRTPDSHILRASLRVYFDLWYKPASR
jgi:hypothetical protein